uniref:Secreted protein n=1 Tax=Steinernema glaseri TaxID=37863 RepID=A0A1I7Z5P2_9BILA
MLDMRLFLVHSKMPLLPHLCRTAVSHPVSSLFVPNLEAVSSSQAYERKPMPRRQRKSNSPPDSLTDGPT